MIATLRKKSQITLPSEIVTKLGLSEGDQLDIKEENGTIMLFPMAVYPTKYIEDLKKEVSEIKAKIASGEQPVFDTVDGNGFHVYDFQGIYIRISNKSHGRRHEGNSNRIHNRREMAELQGALQVVFRVRGTDKQS